MQSIRRNSGARRWNGCRSVKASEAWPGSWGSTTICYMSGGEERQTSAIKAPRGRKKKDNKKKIRQQENQINELKRLLAEKTLEVDFFRGALQKVAARRQTRSASGEEASTTKSGK